MLHHWSRVTHKCVGNVTIIGSNNSPNGAKPHYLNQCLTIVNWTVTDKILWKFNRNSYILIHEIALEGIVCEMATILYLPHCGFGFHVVVVVMDFMYLSLGLYRWWGNKMMCFFVVEAVSPSANWVTTYSLYFFLDWARLERPWSGSSSPTSPSGEYWPTTYSPPRVVGRHPTSDN